MLLDQIKILQLAIKRIDTNCDLVGSDDAIEQIRELIIELQEDHYFNSAIVPNK